MIQRYRTYHGDIFQLITDNAKGYAGDKRYVVCMEMKTHQFIVVEYDTFFGNIEFAGEVIPRFERIE